MGLFDRGRRRRLDNAIEGTALIQESEPFGNPGRDNPHSGEAWTPLDLQLNYFGTRKYRLALEVRIPDRDPYQLEGSFQVPRKAENTGWFAGEVGNALKPGIELPVLVDPTDPESLEVDWDRYLKSPGRKQAQRKATEKGRVARVKEQLESKPEMAAKLRAQNKEAATAWAGAVKLGNMSREEFEETVQLEVDSGRMDPADADAARQSLEG